MKYLHQSETEMNKRLKLFIKNNAFRLSQKVAIKRLKKIVKNSSHQTKRSDGKKILFNLIYGMYGKIIYWECGLAKALQMRGHDVKALICGKTFTMCTTEYTIHSVHNDSTCKNCVDFSRKFLETIDMPYSTYKDYITEKEIIDIKNKVNKLSINECRNYVYKNVDVGAFAVNSKIRYFKGSLNPDENEFNTILRSELINAIIATDVAEKVVEEEKPDVLITRHMGYSSWGSFAQYCKNKGVRICYPGGVYKKDALAFDIKKLDNGFKKYYEKLRKKKPLNEQEEAELLSFLDKRMRGLGRDTSLYGFSDIKIELKKEFNFDKYDKTYAIFPNLPWDISLVDANQFFKDVYEWVSYTIELFKEKPSLQLIIKIHPGEKFKQSENTFLDYINNKFHSLPENIEIIPPDTKMSPYRLFPFIDVGIVYNGIIGLEMAMNDIPVVLGGRTHYGEKGFTYDVSTKKEYRDILFGDISSLKKSDIQLAKVYGYFFFIKSFIPFNLAYDNNFFDIGWNINSLDEIAEGNDKFLDIICNYIAHGGVYQNW